ncbi:COG3942 and LysM peptidoglycan-binding domain-containing protein [Ktedonosporobacter rubrisoli]|uniref:COG3942 and LysM peptidoglycan-binding domain-containing protein n=1 Tax=Ktedonosporobacter rubrisoli TaxID=2509675 RepID=UPI0013EEA3AD|nr:LysM domain-containing protein [Ktedonosporobacter rubrisoli]
MQTHQKIWRLFQQRKVVSFVVRTGVAAAFGLLSLGTTTLGMGLGRVHASLPASCPADYTYTVVRGDTLRSIALSHHVGWQTLATRNRLANPNMIYVQQRLCIPHKGLGHEMHMLSPARMTEEAAVHAAAIGYRNAFPYGACTWWADQRYHELHGTYVPWTYDANAWQWTARAHDFGWHVSKQPTLGSIIDLQPGVQGAYGAGHVGVVERILNGGRVVASSMSWGAKPWSVTYWQFSPGPGVTFISR